MKALQKKSDRGILSRSFTTEADHSRIVTNLCRSIKRFDQKVQNHEGHARVPFNAPNDIQGLDKIVTIDVLSHAARVEANMTMEALVQATLPLGYLPSVVANDRSATVADAFASLTSASSSFRFSTFDCTVTEIEVVLGDGQLVYARPGDTLTEDLFYGSAGALNSLGLMTLFEICLVRAGLFVELTFQPSMQASKPETNPLTSGSDRSESKVESSIWYSAVESLPAEAIDREQVDEASTHLVKAQSTHSIRGDASKPTRSGTIELMHNAEKVQSNDFVEAYQSERPFGVVVTGSFAPTAEFKFLEKGQDFLQLVDHTSQGHRGHVRSMSTASYLFRHDNHRLPQQARNKPRSTVSKENLLTPQHLQAKVSQRYGLPDKWVDNFLQLIGPAPISIHSVLRSGKLGRRLALGVGCPFDYEVGFSTSKEFCQNVLEPFLLDDWKKEIGGPRGFPYLHCRAPCQLGTAWIFHDDRWYVRLRSRWNSKPFADLSERTTGVFPLRFKS